MGTWGAKVTESDLGLDVRDAFLALLRAGGTPKDATRAFLARFADALADPDDRAVVALALAETQLAHGCLAPEVEALAKEVLDARAWSTAGETDRAEREREERRLRRALAAPRKPFRRPAPLKKRDTALAPGDVVALAHRGAWLALWVVGVEPGSRGTYPVLRLLGGPTPEPPDAAACATREPSPATFFLFELKSRARKGSHHVVATRPPPAPTKHWIGAFAGGSDALTLDSALRDPRRARVPVRLRPAR